MNITKQSTALFFCVFIFTSTTIAQTQKELPVETVKENEPQHSVMLIPYDPRFYLSDADKDIVKESRKDAELIRRTFHNRAEWFVFRELKSKYPSVSLLHHDTLDAYINAAGSLFNATVFEYAKPMVPVYENINKVLFTNDNTKPQEDSRTASQYLNERNNDYMNAVVTKKEVLQKLYENFGTDYFVFLTQFEITTNYKACLDIANKIYQREVRLHFAVYDKTGKQVAGNFAVSFIPTSTNHIDDIISTCFPQLAEGVSSAF